MVYPLMVIINTVGLDFTTYVNMKIANKQS